MSLRHAAPVFLLAIALLGVLLVNTTNAASIASIPCIITRTNISPNACIASAMPLAFLGILVSIMLGAVVYAIGMIINYDKLKAFYRNEMWETIKSLIIIAIIFSSLAIASAIAASIAGTGGTPNASSITTNLASIYTTADNNYLVPQLANAERSFSGLLGLSVGTDMIKSFLVSVYLPIPIWTPWTGKIGSADFGVINTPLFAAQNYITSLHTGGGVPTSLLNGAANIVILILISFQVQHDLIYAIAALGLGAMIPIGLIMRSIPFIRGIGGTMIALGIGMSIVYPALLVGFNLPLSNYMYSLTPPQMSATFTCGQTDSWLSVLPHLTCKLFNGMLSDFTGTPGFLTGEVPFDLAFGPTTYKNTPGVSAVSEAGFWTGLLGPIGFVPPSLNDPKPYAYEDVSGGSIYPALNFVISVSLDQIIQFLLFIFDIIIGFAITNAIANVLGGKITPGVGRFRLA